MSGLTNKGFEIKRLQEIKNDVEKNLQTVFGSVRTSPDSVFGQLVGVLSKPLTDLWELAEDLYYSQYPNSAEGVSLDNAVTLTGISRLSATKSEALLALKGDVGTVIPSGTEVAVIDTGKIFSAIDEVRINNTGISRIIISIDTVNNADTYTVTIDSINYDITSDSDATKEEIAYALVTEINDTQSNVVCEDYNNGAFICRKSSADFNLSVDSKMSWYTPSEAEAQEKGSISAPQKSLTEIETPISGWDSVTNFTSATEGRDRETDSELRLRRLESLQIAGSGTPDAISASIREEVEGVVDAFVIENETDDIDGDGRLPHSFETIVSGGDSENIAEKIWDKKPAGIQTVGDRTQSIIDSQGNSHTIKFSRPSEIPIYISVDITKSTEKTFPDNGADQVEENLLEYIDTLSINDDVLYQKLFGIIYQVPGIDTVTLQIGTSSPPGGTSNIDIAQTELAVSQSSYIDISVT